MTFVTFPSTPNSGPIAGRRTVAVLIDFADHLGSGYETQLRMGFEVACEAEDCNLVFVVGRPLFSPDPLSAVHNEVYKLVHPESVHAVVFISVGLGSACGVKRLGELCDSYRPMALCSLGLEIPGVPSIVIDNHSGMEAVVEHIVGEHGCRRVAFISGPQNNTDAAARLQVYQQVLERSGLPFEAELVAFGDFTYSTGFAATQQLLEQGTEFDALIAANDGMAVGAIDALCKRGLLVPRDVRVTGFDDLISARFSNPPLTTARQPLERMAALAIELVTEQWNGNRVPSVTRQAVELVKRRSCGCHASQHLGAAPITVLNSMPPLQFIGDQLERMRALVNEILTSPSGHLDHDSAPLLSALKAEIGGQRDAFLTALEELLQTAGGHNEFFDDVQTAISYLRDEFDAIGAFQLAGLWDAARRAIALANTRSQSEQRSNIEVTYQRLLSCGERFSSVPDFATLGRALCEELPQIPINNVLFALCANGSSAELEPFFGLCDGRVIDPPKRPLPATKLLALAETYASRRRTSYVLPLTFESQYLGVAIFEPESGLGVCGMLREQISFAIKSVALHQEIVKKTALHERSVQDRIAATTRTESLRVMAGGVAHDLNSALSPLVTLPDVILALIEKLGVERTSDGQRLRNYVETIGSAANRATQTIRDLMTLGRQGRTQKAPLDLNWIVASCLSAEPLLSADDKQNHIELTVKLHPIQLLVNASQYHVERAISNLVRNAIEAIGESGTLSVQTGVMTIAERIEGNYVVAPGEYAKVAVSDTGPGIPADMIDRVFEPFFTSKKLRDSSGSGLGLSIVHEVLKEHEGFVNVASEKGQGTTFTLYFPLANRTLHEAYKEASGAIIRNGADSQNFDGESQEAHSAVHGRIDRLAEDSSPDRAKLGT